MVTKKTVKKPSTKQQKNYKKEVDDLIDLNKALTQEIDNLFKSGLPAAQIGKVLGDIISSFDKQTKDIELSL